MASVVGIDLGNNNSKIGVARKRGIDVIANEVSNRATPSLISFTARQRYIGEAAKTAETSNFKNTVGSLKRLLGRRFDDPEVQEIEKKHINAELVDVNGEVGVKVNYLGQPTTFTATQLVATYLGRLRDQAASELSNAVSDVVIAIPGWYNDYQRRRMLAAAEIAGLNPLRLINETTAVALGYGITKSDLPEDAAEARNIVFVDVGHSNMSVSVVAFSKGQLVVKATAFDRNLGGRDLDYALVDHFSEEFKGKYKIDVKSSPKAIFRLSAGAEKLKKILSANAEANLNVESIMNDVDASSRLTREEFESLAPVQDVISRVQAPIQEALREAGLTPDDIFAVELVGGSTRVPAIKAQIAACFPGKTMGVTLNQDEAVARGATFACAMLSPVFKVKEFVVLDIAAYPIKVQWEKEAGGVDEDTELVVFPKNNTIPSTKILTFYRAGPSFDLEAVYAEPASLPGKVNPWIGKVTVKDVKKTAAGDLACVKVKARLNLHGILSFEGAYAAEEVEKDEPAPVATPAPMDTDAPATAEGEAPVPAPKKKVIKKTELPVVGGYTNVEPATLNEYLEKEGEMHGSDKLVTETENAKNALEEYIYDARSKLEDRYAPFVQASEKEKLLQLLSEAEDWLYTEEGEDATKSVYVKKLDEIKVVGNPVTERWKEDGERPKAAAQLRETANGYLEQAQSGSEKYSHIEAKDLESVVEKNAVALDWLNNQMARQSEKPKNINPVITSAEILKKKDELIYFSSPILSKPKPRAPKTDGQAPPPPKEEEPKTEEGPEATVEEMDVEID